MIYSFTNDYSEVAAPQVMQALAALADRQFSGYGCDDVCERARQAIIARLGVPADVHFLIGGTQANAIMIAGMLRPWDAVIAADSGHINVHETGAIEATGHKVQTVPSHDGKVMASDVDDLMAGLMPEHMIHPAALYVSDSTEEGTIYTKAELTALRQCCDRHHLYLYLDGARLGAALMAAPNDLSLADIARLCDAFYIGGTKNGAMFGEAMVIVNDSLKPYFRYLIKQRGALLAKGFALGAQFEALFTDDLFFKLAGHADAMAQRLAQGLKAAGIGFLNDSPTNQVFPLLTADQKGRLEGYGYEEWGRKGDLAIVRLVCSWATPQAAVDGLLARF